MTPWKKDLDISAIQSAEVAPIGSCKNDFLGRKRIFDGFFLRFRPLLQLVDALLVMGAFEASDLELLLRLIDPKAFDFDGDNKFDEGLLKMKLDEPVKLQMCFILQHLCDYQLQYRIEAMIAFSEEFVGRLQAVKTFIDFHFSEFSCFSL